MEGSQFPSRSANVQHPPHTDRLDACMACYCRKLAPHLLYTVRTCPGVLDEAAADPDLGNQTLLAFLQDVSMLCLDGDLTPVT